jgi:hypothetical protein
MGKPVNEERESSAPVATSNSSTCGEVKFPHSVDGGTAWTLVGCTSLGNARGGLFESPALALERGTHAERLQPTDELGRCFDRVAFTGLQQLPIARNQKIGTRGDERSEYGLIVPI